MVSAIADILPAADAASLLQWPLWPIRCVSTWVAFGIDARPMRASRSAAASGQSQPTPAVAGVGSALHADFDLLSDVAGIFQLDAEMANRALQLGAAKQKLDGTQVLRLAVNQRCLGAPHGVRAIRMTIQADLVHPSMNHAGVLPGPEGYGWVIPARKQAIVAVQSGDLDPACKSLPSRCGVLKLDGVTSLVLNHAGTTGHDLAMADIADSQSDKIGQSRRWAPSGPAAAMHVAAAVGFAGNHSLLVHGRPRSWRPRTGAPTLTTRQAPVASCPLGAEPYAMTASATGIRTMPARR